MNKITNLFISKILYISPICMLLMGWEILANLKASPLFPPLSEVLAQLYSLLVIKGSLWMHFTASLLRVLSGFILGSITGFLTGIFLGWNRTAGKSLGAVITVLYPIPALGWLPLLMLWVGINEFLPILIIFICSFFPIVYNTSAGIRNVDARYIKAAKTLGASDLQVLKNVVLPLALPSVFTGLKLEAGMAWRVIIAAEMVAIPTGIGVLMMKAESLIRVDIIMVCLILLSLMCLLFEKIIHFCEVRLTYYWR